MICFQKNSQRHFFMESLDFRALKRLQEERKDVQNSLMRMLIVGLPLIKWNQLLCKVVAETKNSCHQGKALLQ